MKLKKMLIALENLAQESYLLEALVTQVQKSLETEKDLIQRRLLESIGFECRYLIDQFYSGLRMTSGWILLKTYASIFLS